jgi:asparagine synthase (glutamine-hydrolysing)
LQETLLGAGLMQTGIFNRTWVEGLIKQHASGRKDHSAALWALLMFGRCTQQLRATLD